MTLLVDVDSDIDGDVDVNLDVDFDDDDDIDVDDDVDVDVDVDVDDNTALLELGSTCSILASACNAAIMMMISTVVYRFFLPSPKL